MDKYIELIYMEKSIYVKMWEGPYYREPLTAIVKVPKLGLQGLRLSDLDPHASGWSSDFRNSEPEFEL